MGEPRAVHEGSDQPLLVRHALHAEAREEKEDDELRRVHEEAALPQLAHHLANSGEVRFEAPC